MGIYLFGCFRNLLDKTFVAAPGRTFCDCMHLLYVSMLSCKYSGSMCSWILVEIVSEFEVQNGAMNGGWTTLYCLYARRTDHLQTSSIASWGGGTTKAAHAIQKLVERQMWVHFGNIQQMLHVACTNLLGEARETEQLK
jgi:hypothetical protein